MLLYEMVHGLPPFFDKNINIMFQKIKVATPCFSSDISEECTDLITKVSALLILIDFVI